MAEIAELGIKVNSKGVRGATRELDRLESQSKKTERASGRLTGSFSALQGAIAAVGVGFLTKQLIDSINTYTALENRLKLVTDGTEELAAAQQTLFDIAQDTRASLEGTTDLYSRLARSTDTLGISSKELADVTTTINQAIAVSGATAQESSAALFQLGQGLSAGALRGEELNSVLEQTPRLARALADGLGVGIAELREMGAAGELSAERVIAALQNQSEAIDREFGQTEKTISQAMQQIENTFLQTFGSTDGSGIVGALDEFREVLSDPQIVNSLQDVATAIVNVVTWMTKATSATVEFTQWLGEELAAQLNGVSGQDLVRLEMKLQDIDKQLRSIDDGDFQISDLWTSQQHKKALEEERQEVMKLIDAERKRRQQRRQDEISTQTETGGEGVENDEQRAALTLGIPTEGGTEKALKRMESARDKVIQGNEKMSDSMADLQNAIEGWGRESSKAFTDFALHGKTSFSGMIDSMISDMVQMMAYKNVFGPLSQSIMGAFSGGFSGMSGAQAGGAAGALSFAGGGYTGSGPRSGGMDGKGGFPAILHPNETVVDHTKGGGGTTVNIINNVGAEVTTRETSDGNGGQNIEVLIDQAVARNLGQFGSNSNKTLRQQFGANQRLASR